MKTFLTPGILIAVVILLTSASSKSSIVLQMESDVSSTKTYVGQPIIYTEKLVFVQSEDIGAVTPISNPVFAGFEVVEITPEPARSDFRKGEKFTVAHLRSFILFPKHKGILKAGGGSYEITKRVPTRTYHPQYGEIRSYDIETVELMAKSVPIKVKNLPAKAPAGFSGIVGNFEMSYEVPEGRIVEGEEAQFILKMEGSGYIRAEELPNLQALFPKEMGVKAISANPQICLTSEGVKTIAEFEFAFTPTKSGAVMLPGIGIHVFNPQKGEYEVVSAEPINIEVKKMPKKIKEATIYV